MKIFTIKITNWDKHNGGKTKGDWFKLSQYFLDDPAITSLTDKQVRFYIYLLCLASRSRSATVKLSATSVRPSVNLNGTSVQAVLSKLSELHLIESLEEKREEEKREEGLAITAPSKTIFRHPKNFKEFVVLFQDKIPHWIQLYPDWDWMQREFQKAYQYFYIDGQKAPSASFKGWNRRMKSWLDRGWESHARKTEGQRKSKEKAVFKPENFL